MPFSTAGVGKHTPSLEAAYHPHVDSRLNFTERPAPLHFRLRQPQLQPPFLQSLFILKRLLSRKMR
jgi:hypothetical protein